VDLSKLSPEAQTRIAREILALKTVPRAWEDQAYYKQLPPDHPRHHLADPVTGLACGCAGMDLEWETWLLVTGRGTGKTRCGANWALTVGLSEPDIWVGVCAPTFIDIKRVCFEGPSGIEKVAEKGEIREYNKNGLRFTLRNGSVIQGYTADRPDSIRGANLAYVWFDELGSIRAPDFYHFGLLPALRESKGRMLVTTTPRNVGIIGSLIKDAKDPAKHVHYTRATSMENWKSPSVLKMVEKVKRQYGLDSFLGRQELLGELVDDLPGQLFRIQDIDKYRVDEFPSLRRTIVAVDPASSANMRSDETGIVVVGEGEDRHYYTLQDVSMQATTDKVMSAIVGAFYRWEADIVVVEKNVAGDWFRQALYDKDPHVSYKPVQAMKGKLIRAQPLSPLMERGFFHMVGREFDELERQLTAMTAYDDRVKQHDDRADAWVWGMRELSGMGNVDWGEIYGFRTCLACGHKVNIRLEKSCRACGNPVEPDSEPKEKNTTRSVRWSNAYQKTCEQGHEYPMRLPRCPKCHDDQEYLARVSGLTNPSRGSRSVYTGRDPLSRRNHV
jgi:predicted phage terminase large subunit-like protein